jgi:hypothetical protein
LLLVKILPDTQHLHQALACCENVTFSASLLNTAPPAQPVVQLSDFVQSPDDTKVSS